jgi:phosphoribosylaminoimidazole-succinocarboxamide synthase
MLVRRLRMHPVECVVRGYLTGSGLAEYRATGAICGVRLPPGLQDGDRLPEPIFTPATKAEQGAHDENIPFERVVELVGRAAAERLRDTSLTVFRRADAITRERGLLLADTKLELGDDPHTGELTLADEVLTSDSSRYWDAAAYDAGRRGESFDKQIVRDWLRAHWDGEGRPPRLPDDVVARTADRYAELLARLGA